MKKILRQALLDARIINLIDKHIYLLHKPESIVTDTYIEYHIVRESYNNFAGNENLAIDYVVQVSIFSKGDFTQIEKVIKEVLKENGFNFEYGAELYEEDTGLFHVAQRYKYKKINWK